MRMRRKILIGFCGGALTWLAGCGGSGHTSTEKYWLVATNIKIPYWQSVNAGLMHAAQQIGVKAEMVGPDSFDPKAEHEAFQRVLAEKIKPAGIMVSAADPAVMQPDIDAAIGQNIPVITVDSDAPASKRLTFIGTDNYTAGLMGAQLAVKQLQGKGNVVIFTMPEQANLKDRLHGYHDGFESHFGIKIVETVDIKGDPRIAFDHTQELVDKKIIDKIDGFICLEAIACPKWPTCSTGIRSAVRSSWRWTLPTSARWIGSRRTASPAPSRKSPSRWASWACRRWTPCTTIRRSRWTSCGLKTRYRPWRRS